MKRLSTLVFVFAMVVAAWAVPARRGGMIITQPDGSQITVYQHGDENFHWQTNEKGEWLKMDVDGFYRTITALTAEEIEAKRIASPKRAGQTAVSLNIAPRGLVILVNFADIAFTTEKAEMDSMLTAINYTRNYSYTCKGKQYDIRSQGSARQYFYDSSHGQYNPQFDVVGPVTVSKDMSYYGKDDRYGNDMYPDKMVSEACKLADSECDVDFSQYDNDRDGYVDFVFVIYAGYGEADGGGVNTIWPHAWQLETAAGGRCLVDGKKVDIPSCQIKPGSVIELKDNYKNNQFVAENLEATASFKDFVEVDKDARKGKYVRYPERKELNQEINELLVIEYYNR